MNKLRHPVAALVVMYILIVLSGEIYEAFQEGYGFESDDLQEGVSIQEALQGLSFLQGAEQIAAAISKLKTPSNPLDMLGALSAAGIGILKIIGGIVVFPIQIFSIVGNYYHIPGVVSTGLGLLVNVYIFFIMLSAYLGKDL